METAEIDRALQARMTAEPFGSRVVLRHDASRVEIAIDGETRFWMGKVAGWDAIIGGWRARAEALADALADVDRGDIVTVGDWVGGPAGPAPHWRPARWGAHAPWRAQHRLVTLAPAGDGTWTVAVAEASAADLAAAEQTPRVVEERERRRLDSARASISRRS